MLNVLKVNNKHTLVRAVHYIHKNSVADHYNNFVKMESSLLLMHLVDMLTQTIKFYKFHDPTLGTTNVKQALRKNCPNTEFFLVRIFPYLD